MGWDLTNQCALIAQSVMLTGLRTVLEEVMGRQRKGDTRATYSRTTSISWLVSVLKPQ